MAKDKKNPGSVAGIFFIGLRRNAMRLKAGSLEGEVGN
jgi:hypothetical protein